MGLDPEADEGFSSGHLGSDHPVTGRTPEGERGLKIFFWGNEKSVVLFGKKGG